MMRKKQIQKKLDLNQKKKQQKNANDAHLLNFFNCLNKSLTQHYHKLFIISKQSMGNKFCDQLANDQKQVCFELKGSQYKFFGNHQGQMQKPIQNISYQRKYLPRKLLQLEQLMLMVASSAKRQNLYSQYQQKCDTLTGINYDIDYFVNRSKGYRYHLFETSLDEARLLPKQYILSSLKKYFRKPVLNFYLFYSGHGEEDPFYKGDIVLQSKDGIQVRQKKLREFTISLQDITIAWNYSKLCLQSHLYILMDSCFSGNWCKRLSCMNQPSISIFAACGPESRAYGLRGSLFFKTILGNENQFQYNFQQLIHKQTPIFIKNSKKCASLTKNHLKLMQMNIKNVENFSSQTEFVQLRFFPTTKREVNNVEEIEEINRYKKKKFKVIKQKQNSSIKMVQQEKEILYFPPDSLRLKYECQVNSGKMHGEGILFWKNGDRFQGMFEYGKRNGKGTYYYKNGDRFEGTYKNDKRQGKGILYYANGERKVEYWVNDHLDI